jgi:hypothetical protein
MRSFFLSLLAASVALNSFAQPTNIAVEPGVFHVGDKSVSSFPQASRRPNGPRLERAFESQSNPDEWTLRLRQQNVTDDWGVEINGQPIARLNIASADRLAHFSIPPGTLMDGTNTLTIVPRGVTNDILVSQIEIIPQRMRDLLKLAHVVLTITEPNGRVPAPARVTIVDAQNKLAELYNVKPATVAWRRGIFYTGGMPVEFDLPQGEWTVTATRGMEWNRAHFPLRTFVGQNARVTLPLARSVDTAGYIAADTHVHTYTFSGHGDASVDERIVTLTGEGVELAMATDHNHFADYKSRQEELGASSYFTSVIGNEVTTGNGHFNAFPFASDAEKPNYKETNWPKLVADIRGKGAQFVILNHPRWPSLTNSPFAIWGLNRVTGSRTNSFPFTFDAIELMSSTSGLKDPDFLLRDWFALLNHGDRIWAVGASDSHTIADPIGQARTYIASAAEDPGAIEVDAAIKSMRAGNMSVSYGIFGTATVNGRAHMGEVIKPGADGAIDVTFHVGCPDWIKARKAAVYLNGIKIAEQELTMTPRIALSTNVVFKLPAPSHDAYVVCVASGDGVKDSSWKTMVDYTRAVTNPIFIDADGDGKYSSPRDSALAELKKIDPLTADKLGMALAKVDATVGMQMISEARLRVTGADLAAIDALLDRLAEKNESYNSYRTISR